MKKLLSLLLATAMLLSLCACNGGADPADTQSTDPTETTAASTLGEGLNVGFAKVNITPNYDVGLGGYSNAETRRNSEAPVTDIYATCLAFTEGEETILVYTVDSIAMTHGSAELHRAMIMRDTGVPMEKIFFGATHSHNCPEPAGQYLTDLTLWLIEAGKKAMADRAPVTMLVGTTEIPGMNFVRHYLMEDGTYAGSNFGDYSLTPVAHAGNTDPQMILIKFDYADPSRRNVLMVNWQAHPDDARKIGFNSIAAGFVGPLRDELETLSGMQVAYFTGASGNLVRDSWIDEEQHLLPWDDYGVKLAQKAYEALSTLQTAPGSGIKTTRELTVMEVDHSWDRQLKQAKEVYDLWKAEGIEKGNALAKEYNFTSVYQARTIITRSDYGPFQKCELCAFSIDGVGFTTGNYEMFADNGLYVKENSPFDVTFIITGNNGYIPTKEAFEYRSYEADTGNFAAGVGEKLAELYVQILHRVK